MHMRKKLLLVVLCNKKLKMILLVRDVGVFLKIFYSFIYLGCARS